MPLYRKKKAYSVSVPLGTTGSSVDYAFLSSQDMTGLLADFGITELTDANTPISGIALGASHPKPSRATKPVLNTKTKSSFCTAATATTNGFKPKDPKRRYKTVHTLTSNSLVVSVFVQVGGIKRAWNMHKTQEALINGDFTELGIDYCDANDAAQYVWGCEAPYPAKVRKVNSSGTDGADVYTTFCSQTKENSLLTWAKIAERVTVGALLW